ncbi:hypothetical protein ACH47B_01530 [Rhodococcus sp. NPDC019627]|uniref:hypothetical protein n=1 Tax=unclassified Rhodococcus (in: high G+C Gram-positive bacteria) TaxID=192944 RepID=UPI0033E4A738
MSYGQDLPREVGELITLARQWLPYGRVPPELIFQTFGITEQQFVDRLWVAVQDARCDTHLVRAFASIYPPRRGPGGLPTMLGRAAV